MNDTDAVVQSEGRVPQSVGLIGVEVDEYPFDQALFLVGGAGRRNSKDAARNDPLRL